MQRALTLLVCGTLFLAFLACGCMLNNRRREGYRPPVQPVAEADLPGRKVCILMYSTRNILPYAGWAARANLEYAKRHGYAFRHIVDEKCPVDPPMWYKPLLMRQLLKDHEAVFWIDSDAAFNKQDTSLDRLLNHEADVLGCSDQPNGPYHINCGTLLVKRSPWSKVFMDRWCAMRSQSKYHKWAFEQEALHDLIEGDVLGARSHVHIEKADSFNSIHADIARGKEDTFVLHYMAHKTPRRVERLRALCERLR